MGGRCTAVGRVAAVVCVEKRGAGRDDQDVVREPRQLLVIMERGEGVDRCFNGDKLNDDITNQVSTDRGRATGPFRRDGRYLGNARRGALLQEA